jgi:hypothetical protein
MSLDKMQNTKMSVLLFCTFTESLHRNLLPTTSCELACNQSVNFLYQWYHHGKIRLICENNEFISCSCPFNHV